MKEEFHSQQPIYQQIADRLIKQIISGALQAGEKLPSIRDMGITANVNPNTVQRTYRELEMMDIVESRRGQGTFVTEDAHILKMIREKMKTELITNFFNEMDDIGFERDEIIRSLQDFLQEKGD